jgi:hypothetical protein
MTLGQVRPAGRGRNLGEASRRTKRVITERRSVEREPIAAAALGDARGL